MSLTRKLTLTALSAALLCVLAPLSVPVGPVPLSLATLIVMLMPYLLGTGKSVIAVALYLGLGAAGLPVFSGWTGGLAKLSGPTGGYLAGYLLLALAAGLTLRVTGGRFWPTAAGFALGTLLLYAVGTAWLTLATQMPLPAALTAGVLPFLPGDAVKIALAAKCGPLLAKAKGTPPCTKEQN